MIDIVFLGTPDFAVPSLAALIEAGYNIKGVITQPDRPKGRSKAPVAPPVKEFALKQGISVFQPEKIKNENEILCSLKPDLMVTAAFGQILSAENLSVAPLGCVNVHGSLLPAYRGSSPIQWAVINGEKYTGITTMYTALGVDCGDIILQKKVEILPNETAGELFDRLALLGAQVLLETVKKIEDGTAPRIAQNEKMASHYPMLNKDMARMDFSRKADEIVNLVRGLNPWPCASTSIDDIEFKVFSAEVLNMPRSGQAGTLAFADQKNGIVINAADRPVALRTIRVSGKNQMDSRDYLRGHNIQITAKIQ